MDKKKTLIALVILLLVCSFASKSYAQDVSSVEFCDRFYEYGVGKDTIKLFFNLKDANNKRISKINEDEVKNFLSLYEGEEEIMNGSIRKLSSGVRIPKEYTFSVVLDQSISQSGKEQVWGALQKMVEMTADSSVYVSFYGDGVSSSVIATSANMQQLKAEYFAPSDKKTFYSAVYAKLLEFCPSNEASTEKIITIGEYRPNSLITKRANLHRDKNILMIFADGSQSPDNESFWMPDIVNFQRENADSTLPRVVAFYYTEGGEDEGIKLTLEAVAEPRDENLDEIEHLKGSYHPSSNMKDVISNFQTIVNESAYDYEFAYTATEGKAYMGNVKYVAKWGKNGIGETVYPIGSAEKPWPEKVVPTANLLFELLVALLVTLLTFVFFFFVTKVIVPYIQSLMFKSRYYKPYKPEPNVQRRICHYCKQEIKPGQIIVTKCSHLMHVHCWKENGYKCAEYGQNCKIGIENHVEWKELFKLSSLKDCIHTLSGIAVGLLSWVIYELSGRGIFTALSQAIVGFIIDPAKNKILFSDCVSKTSSFLTIGLLLGLFISIVFRFMDEIRDKNLKVWLKIMGLSILTAFIGMLAFMVGADILCLIVSKTGNIAWYCSLPAYMLFSVFVSLALTIKSTIPVKSALLGGGFSAIIGFFVLYFSHFVSATYDYLPMLLDFVIYGGGLGASLITVRMLAERYFLVIQNGVKAGQRIPIHKWMNATGGGNKVSIGMTGECEIQMNWEKSSKVAKEHAQLFIDHNKMLPVIKPLATGVVYNNRAELPVNRHSVLSNGDTFKIGDTIFKYEEA